MKTNFFHQGLGNSQYKYIEIIYFQLWFIVPGQITTIPKLELRPFWEDPPKPFGVTSVVAIICPDPPLYYDRILSHLLRPRGPASAIGGPEREAGTVLKP